MELSEGEKKKKARLKGLSLNFQQILSPEGSKTMNFHEYAKKGILFTIITA